MGPLVVCLAICGAISAATWIASIAGGRTYALRASSSRDSSACRDTRTSSSSKRSGGCPRRQSLALSPGQDSANRGCNGSASTAPTGTQRSSMLSGSLTTGANRSIASATTVVYDQ